MWSKRYCPQFTKLQSHPFQRVVLSHFSFLSTYRQLECSIISLSWCRCSQAPRPTVVRGTWPMQVMRAVVVDTYGYLESLLPLLHRTPQLTMHYELCTMHYPLSTINYALCTMYYALITVHYAFWAALPHWYALPPKRCSILWPEATFNTTSDGQLPHRGKRLRQVGTSSLGFSLQGHLDSNLEHLKNILYQRQLWRWRMQHSLQWFD